MVIEKKNMKSLVSVIVPIYKVEEHLQKCLDSLCRQSLFNIEILLIDDASPDKCGEICEEYVKKDNRFRVIHNITNQGLSVARNIGIENATADYLMFVDSDDWAHEDFCKDAYECAIQQKTDIVMFAYQNIIGSDLNKNDNNFVSKVASGLKTREEAIELTFESFGMVAWNKLYHKKLFNNIVYPKGYLFEDTATTYKLLWNASGIYCLDKVLYYHLRARPGSIMSNRKTAKAIKDAAMVQLRHCNDLYSWGYRSKRLETSLISAALCYCVVNKKDVTDSDYLIAERILKEIRIIPEDKSWKAQIMIRLFQVSPKLFELVCEMWGKRWN